jgi:NADH-quinone oxidoreductase subunit N
VSVVAFAAWAGALATVALLTRRLRVASAAIGLLGLAGAVAAAAAIEPGRAVIVGGLEVAASPYLRLFLLLGSIVGVLIVLLAATTTWRRDLPAATLLSLATAAIALAVPEPVVGVLAATAGGLAVLFVLGWTMNPGQRLTVTAREVRATALAGVAAICAIVIVASPVRGVPDPGAIGVALLAMTGAVAVRVGAVPFHQHAARLADVTGAATVPLLLVWGPAAFALVVLTFAGPSVAPLQGSPGLERTLVSSIGALGLVLGVTAAILHEDLDRIVAYSIIADAGVVLLALASLDPAAWGPARTWLLAFVVSKTALAAWALAMHARFGTQRVGSLSGWCGRAPVLAVALVIIAAAAVGWPGLAMFEARGAIFTLSLGRELALVLTLATLGAIGYFGRILVVGLGAPGPAVTAPIARARFRAAADTPEGTAPTIRPATPGGGLAGLLAGLPGPMISRTAAASLLVGLLAVLSVAVAAGGIGAPDPGPTAAWPIAAATPAG